VEIYNGQISCISFSSDPKLAISIPFLDRYRHDYWSVHQEMEMWETIARLLANPTSLKINQNILFDMFMLLYRMGIHTKGPVADTMVAFNLMYVDFKKGLDVITSLYTREPYYKDEGKIWRNPFRDMTSFWRYNAKDAACALEAWLAMEPELRSGGYRATHDETVAMYDPLLFMMVRGLRVDNSRLAEARDRLKLDLQHKMDSLREIADFPFNALSPKQCQQYFYIHKGARPYVSPKTGQVTTDDLALARLWRRHHWPEIKLVQEIRTLNKLGGTYYDVTLDKDNRLRGSYNPRGTWTGRLSSSETVFGTGLNLQNLDPSFKAFIVPDEETVA
jgi:DNA polymerase I-like protein with 3'-5' exonuclease and polymerase domains